MTATAEAPGRRVRILLVEDDSAVRRALQLLLTARGFDVRAYPSATGLSARREALAADCLIADLVMPNIDGFGLLRGLRHAGWEGPAVLISGHLTDDSERQARKEGYDVILRKPLAETALISCLSRLLPTGSASPPNR